METRTQNFKLAELRSKTDRQLFELVRRNLERPWGREEARRLLPYLASADRRRIERRMQELEATGQPLRACCS